MPNNIYNKSETDCQLLNDNSPKIKSNKNKIYCRKVVKNWRKEAIRFTLLYYPEKNQHIFLDKLCAVFHKIDRLRFFKDEESKFNFIQINCEQFYDMFEDKEWRGIRKNLIAFNLLEVKEGYTVADPSKDIEGKCMEFRIHTRFNHMESTLHYFTKPGKQLSNFFKSQNDKIINNPLADQWNKGLINVGIRNWYSVLRTYKKKLKLKREESDLKLAKIEIKTYKGTKKRQIKKKSDEILAAKAIVTSYEEQLNILATIKNEGLECSRDWIGRVHSPITRMDSDLRDHLYDMDTGDDFCEIDIACSQPVIFWLTMLDYLPENDPEMASLQQLIQDDIYLQLIPEDSSHLTRKEIKQILFRDFFYGVITDNEITRKFKESYPKIFDIMVNIKSFEGEFTIGNETHTYVNQFNLSKEQRRSKIKFKKSYSLLSQRMQQIESSHFIDGIISELKKISNTVLSIHDSALIPKRHFKLSLKIICKYLIENKLGWISLNTKTITTGESNEHKINVSYLSGVYVDELLNQDIDNPSNVSYLSGVYVDDIEIANSQEDIVNFDYNTEIYYYTRPTEVIDSKEVCALAENDDISIPIKPDSPTRELRMENKLDLSDEAIEFRRKRDSVWSEPKFVNKCSHD